MERAVLAGGCFWGMEDLIRKIPGVQKTRVGYTGGHLKNPTYQDVCTETTGHAEAIEIFFDPSKVTFRRLLEFFFQIHDPTTIDRQGNDIGDSYRSHIFTTSPEQHEEASQNFSEGVTFVTISPGHFFELAMSEIIFDASLCCSRDVVKICDR